MSLPCLGSSTEPPSLVSLPHPSGPSAHLSRSPSLPPVGRSYIVTDYGSLARSLFSGKDKNNYRTTLLLARHSCHSRFNSTWCRVSFLDYRVYLFSSLSSRSRKSFRLHLWSFWSFTSGVSPPPVHTSPPRRS